MEISNSMFLGNEKFTITGGHLPSKEEKCKITSRNGTPVAAASSNSTQNLQSLASLGLTKRKGNEPRGYSVNSGRAGPVLAKKRLIKKKDPN